MVVAKNSRPQIHARRIGWIDETVPAADLPDSATRLAESLIGKPPRRTSSLPVRDTDKTAFDDACKRWAGRARGQRSAQAVVEAVRDAIGTPFGEAVERSFKTFVSLRSSDQSAALRHLFFAEREALRMPDVDLKSARPVKTVGIAGAGTMGRGIAAACLKADLSVVLIDSDSKTLERARPALADSLARLARSDQWPEGETERKLATLSLALLRIVVGVQRKPLVGLDQVAGRYEVSHRTVRPTFRVPAIHARVRFGS